MKKGEVKKERRNRKRKIMEEKEREEEEGGYDAAEWQKRLHKRAGKATMDKNQKKMMGGVSRWRYLTYYNDAKTILILKCSIRASVMKWVLRFIDGLNRGYLMIYEV